MQHELDADFRDENDNGFRVRLTNEVAGTKLGGDLHHMRHTVNATLRVPLVGDVHLGLSARAGLLAPFTWWRPKPNPVAAAASVNLPLLRRQPTHIGDRFFLGGSQDVRGFGLHSLGPKNDRFAVGADAYWAAAAHLWSPFPGRLRAHIGDAVKLHLFANAGSACRAADVNQTMAEQLRQSRRRLTQVSNIGVAVGGGVSAELNFCTVELNYVLPLNTPGESIARPGFSASVGFEFL